MLCDLSSLVFFKRLNPITTGRAESARAVNMLYAAQKQLARFFSNFMTFPDFYSSKS